MKVLFPVLVLCTAAVVAVVLAIHFRVKRHLREQSPPSPVAETPGDEERTEDKAPEAVEDVKENHSS
jgi:hypothetical protein